MRKEIRQIIANTSAQLFSRLLLVLLSLLTTSLLTRWLGPEGWGDYVFLTSFVLLLVAVSDWGTQVIGVRELSRARGKKNKSQVVVNLFFLRFFLALAGFVFGLVVIKTTSLFRGIFWPAFWALFLVFLLSFDTSLEVVFQSFLRMERKAFLDLVYGLFFLLFSFLALWEGKGLLGVVVSWFLARLIVVFLGWRLSSRFVSWSGFMERQWLKRLFYDSLPTGALLILFTVYDRGIDTIFLKYFSGEAAVGFYGLAYKVYGNLVLPAYFLANSLFPFFSQKKKRLSFLFRLGLGGAFLGGVAALSFTWVLAGWIVGVLAGEAFSPAVFLLRLLALALPFAWLNHILGFFLIAADKQVLSLKIGALALVWNLVLNWVFIPRFAAPAAAMITVSTEGLVFFLYLSRFKHLVDT